MKKLMTVRQTHPSIAQGYHNAYVATMFILYVLAFGKEWMGAESRWTLVPMLGLLVSSILLGIASIPDDDYPYFNEDDFVGQRNVAVIAKALVVPMWIMAGVMIYREYWGMALAAFLVGGFLGRILFEIPRWLLDEDVAYASADELASTHWWIGKNYFRPDTWARS